MLPDSISLKIGGDLKKYIKSDKFEGYFWKNSQILKIQFELTQIGNKC